MLWEGRDHDGSCCDGVDEFEREELAGADKTGVVFVDEAEGEEGEEVGEEEVDGEVGVGVV